MNRDYLQSGLNKLPVCFILLISMEVSAQSMTDYTGPVFPANHALNIPIDTLPVHPNSYNYVASIGMNTSIHPDFGTSWDDEGTLRPMGIPYNVVGSDQPFVNINFISYPEESDLGPWPIPANPYIETVFDWRETDPGDRHMLIVNASSHILYETGGVYKNADSIWEGGCGAVFDLNSNALREETWTSADAAGLPIFPLLIRYDEVSRALSTDGIVHHPIRFTAVNTQRAYVWPARHYASSSTDPNRPPMGLRFRLKDSIDISGFSSRMQVILRSMKKYGIIVSDNGGNWYFQGTHDDRWDGDDINTLKSLHGRDFEAVDISSWMSRPGFDPNSAAVPGVESTSVPAYHASTVSQDFILVQNYPNPFNSSTTIRYSLPSSKYITVKIFNVMGQEVVQLINAFQKAGTYHVQWNAYGYTSGVYFCRLTSGNSITTNKLLLMK